MKLVLTSDLHGNLVNIPPCDVFVIAGDIMTMQYSTNPLSASALVRQAEWLKQKFIPYLERQPCRHVVMTWGNHDHVGEHAHLLPTFPANVHVLNNSSVTLDGVKFYGYPWTPRFFNWAFNVDRDSEDEARHMAAIPEDTQVLVSHGPPEGCVDGIDQLHVGSALLSKRVRELSHLELLVCGHVHAGVGVASLMNGKRDFFHVMNCSRVDEAYRPVHPVREVDLDRLALPVLD